MAGVATIIATSKPAAIENGRRIDTGFSKKPGQHHQCCRPREGVQARRRCPKGQLAEGASAVPRPRASACYDPTEPSFRGAAQLAPKTALWIEEYMQKNTGKQKTKCK